LKVYILTDLEGATGVVREEQTRPGTQEYLEACRLLTGDVNAAVEGALKGGADEVYVLDGHGARGGFNLVIEELHPAAKYIMGGPRPCAIPFLERGFSAAFLVGYHAMAGTAGAVLDHTMSTRVVYEVRVNGLKVGEIGIHALILGVFNIPVALVTGCKKAVEEAKSLLGDIEAVEVKEGLSRNSALLLPPRKTRPMIMEAAERALKRLGDFKPFKMEPSYTVEITFTHPVYADEAEKKPLAERVDDRTVKFADEDLLKVFHAIGWY